MAAHMYAATVTVPHMYLRPDLTHGVKGTVKLVMQLHTSQECRHAETYLQYGKEADCSTANNSQTCYGVA